jgi:hypothetical protein
MLAFGAIGAGVGAVIDFGIHGYSMIDGEPLASPNALRVPAPVASLDELWRRVRQGDQIDVATIGAQKVTGKFVRVSNTFVTLMVDGKQRQILPNDAPRNPRRQPLPLGRARGRAIWGPWVSSSRRIATEAGAAPRCRDVRRKCRCAMGRGDRRIPRRAVLKSDAAARPPARRSHRARMVPGSVGVAFLARSDG